MWIVGKQVKTKVIIEGKEVGHQNAGYRKKYFKHRIGAILYLWFIKLDSDEESPFVLDKEVIISYTLSYE